MDLNLDILGGFFLRRFSFFCFIDNVRDGSCLADSRDMASWGCRICISSFSLQGLVFVFSPAVALCSLGRIFASNNTPKLPIMQFLQWNICANRRNHRYSESEIEDDDGSSHFFLTILTKKGSVVPIGHV